MTMIVEDTIAIGRRLREIEEGGKRPVEFKLPDDILIVRSIDAPLRFKQDYEVILVLHETRTPKLAVAHIRNPETARQKMIEFLRMFEQNYPSAQAVSGEILISQADCAKLLDSLRRRP